MYHAIYSCNNLLRLFDKNQDVIFIKGAREVMLAELKVLRVAMHYDLVACSIRHIPLSLLLKAYIGKRVRG